MFQTLPIQGCRMPRGCHLRRTTGARTESSPCPTSAASTPCARPCTARPSLPPSHRGTPCTYARRSTKSCQGRQATSRKIRRESRRNMDLRLPEVDNVAEGRRGPRCDARSHLHEDVRREPGDVHVQICRARSPLSSLAFLRPFLQPNKHV